MTASIPAANIKLKRAYEPVVSNDGARVLVDRLWPRGVSKEDASLDQWMKEIAPTTEFENGLGTIRLVGRNSAAAMAWNCIGMPSF